MSCEILSVGEAGKHAGAINTLLFTHDHVFSGGKDGVINVRYSLMFLQRTFVFKKKIFPVDIQVIMYVKLIIE